MKPMDIEKQSFAIIESDCFSISIEIGRAHV